MPNPDLVARARQYAIEGHARIDQRRRYTGLPYDVHLQAVAATVARVTDDAEVIAAAWLHDIVEDTPATYEDLEREFGARVAHLVLEVTDVSRPLDGSRAVRKALDREHLAQASPPAQTIKLADLIDNCPDVCRHDESFARVFLAEADALLHVLGGGDTQLLQQCRQIVTECAERLRLVLPALSDEPAPDDTAPEVPFPLHDALAEIFTTAFTARHIAQPLHSFDAGRTHAALAAEMGELRLAVAGVRVHGVVRGYVRSVDLQPESQATAPLRKFWRDQVLPAEASLADVIHVLTRHEHCFVSILEHVNGTISRADTQSPVVRMWLFGMITWFEMHVAARIAQRWPGDSWEAQLAPARLAKAHALRDERARRGQASTVLDCLQFSEKALLVLEDAATVGDFGFPSKATAKRVVKDLESLRNNLAHSQDIVLHDWPQIARLARQIHGAGPAGKQPPRR
jgi:hypothetical protein